MDREQFFVTKLSRISLGDQMSLVKGFVPSLQERVSAEHRGDGQTGVVLSSGSINATPASVNAEMKFDNEKFKLPVCLPVSSEDNSLWNEV